jgi:hypothetical protein
MHMIGADMFAITMIIDAIHATLFVVLVVFGIISQCISDLCLTDSRKKRGDPPMGTLAIDRDTSTDQKKQTDQRYRSWTAKL